MGESMLPAFANGLDTTLLVHDPWTDGILDANDAAEDLYGYTTEQLRRMSIDEVSTESPRFSAAKAVERIREAAGGERKHFEWQIRRSNGEVRWVDVRLRPYAFDDEEYVLAEIRDISDFKTRTRRLQLLHRIIRHNLRNDMSVVMGYAENLKRVLETEDYERQAEIIRDVASGVGDLTESVAEIEEIASNDADDFEETSVTGLLEDLAAKYESANPNVTVRVDYESDITMLADRGLRYGVQNAIENAVEHHDGGDDGVEVRLTAWVDEAAERIVLRVVDDGPPIPDVEVDAIDPDEETSDLSHGSGVGLFVMKWCAESLGGKLDIYENNPRGNVVEFTFPQLESVEIER
jgi:PAS domain S-box-containing protein